MRKPDERSRGYAAGHKSGVSRLMESADFEGRAGVIGLTKHRSARWKIKMRLKKKIKTAPWRKQLQRVARPDAHWLYSTLCTGRRSTFHGSRGGAPRHHKGHRGACSLPRPSSRRLGYVASVGVLNPTFTLTYFSLPP